MRQTIFAIIFFAFLFPVMGQEGFYDVGKIQEIRIIMHEKNWKHMLDSVFTSSLGNDRLDCDILINGQLLKNVGIRYKGFSSVDVKDVKNPFNIDLAYSRNNNNYKGYTSLRLGNVNYDPSFIREALSYEIARKYMPASHANFAHVYVNDTLLGLYSNVEAVNAEFLTGYFSGNGNSFIKGSPATLEYPFGQNANLANTHGTDSTAYQPFYALESDYGWSDLYHFIAVLNQDPDSISQVLNVDRALWMHAFNYALLNLDSYIGYSQNYYMYKDNNGIFQMIPWDMNMSFGSFRHSDGSTHFNGLTIPQTKQLNPLGLIDFAVSPRPLVTKLLKNDTLRRMFLAHMRTIVEENLSNNEYFTRGQLIQAVIDSSVNEDTNKFYSYEYFHENLLNTVGSSGSANEFPGIRDLVEARVNYLDTLPGIRGAPVIGWHRHDPEVPVKGQQAWFTVQATGTSRVFLGFRFRSADAFTKIPMEDDGNHHDSIAGDGIYGASLLLTGPVIQYYFYAENDSAGIFSPERAEYQFFSLQPMIVVGDVVLNEFHTGSGIETWIELLNTSSEPLNLGGMKLSDDPASPAKWEIQDTVIPPKKYLLIYPGENIKAGTTASSITLPTSRGTLRLSNASGLAVDSASYGLQVAGKSTGRYPNGTGAMTFMLPTKGSYNTSGTTPGTGFLLYPNPAREVVNIEIMDHSGPVSVTIINSLGKPVLENTTLYNTSLVQPVAQPVDISTLGSGLYMIRVGCNGAVTTQKLVIY